MRDTIKEYFDLQGRIRERLRDKNNEYLRICGINALMGKLNIEYMSLFTDKLIVSMGEQQTTMEVDILGDDVMNELNTFIKVFIYNFNLVQ
jgi:hypothetical protein